MGSASTPEQRLAELGITLPEPPAPAAAYQPWSVDGDVILTAGQVPMVEGTLAATGKLGDALSTEQGAQVARTCAINVLAVGVAAARAVRGDGAGLADLRVLRLGVYVASTPDFVEQHLVANGASELIGDVLGDAGVHARTAVGVPVLPLDCPVEVEATIKLR